MCSCTFSFTTETLNLPLSPPENFPLPSKVCTWEEGEGIWALEKAHKLKSACAVVHQKWPWLVPYGFFVFLVYQVSSPPKYVG